MLVLSAIILYTKFHYSTNELTPGSLIRSIKDSKVLDSHEENFDTENKFNSTKDFTVESVDQNSDNDEEVEIIVISCCPRIRSKKYSSSILFLSSII